ncbi:Ltp family lipoprotein [Actinoplanes sp. NPDC051494]|uniref:Ltp family lipoprotein n=1 Tax=Actinoplanes sp. NPDC051494 TaxID=3363907 RepID=UPI0037AD5902
MKKILVSISTVFIAVGLIGTAAPAQAQSVTPHTVAAASYSVAVKKESVAQRNARSMAASYLDYTAFSRSGLIAQLKFEGFSTKLATYGVDKQHANWNKQAARMAQAYLDYTSFSRAGLIAQLKFEGFTTSQAKYGVKKVGL